MVTASKGLKAGDRTTRLVLSAVMIALAVVLSYVKLWQMPLGGSITLCSMLPILLIGYMYGPRRGALTGLVYAVIQMLLDSGLLSGFSGTSWQAAVGSIFLDYLIAFSVLGLSGIYGKGFGRYIAGMVTAVFIRFVSHVISGVVIFYAYAFDSSSFPSYLGFLQGRVLLYSMAYNAFYLLPDLILCLIAGTAIYKPLKKFIEA